MKRSKKPTSPRPKAVAFCTFCNLEIGPDHTIEPCPDCPGKVHYNGNKGECTCCGRKFERPVPVEEPQILTDPEEMTGE